MWPRKLLGHKQSGGVPAVLGSQVIDPEHTGTRPATLILTAAGVPVVALLLSVVFCLALAGVTGTTLRESLLGASGWAPFLAGLAVAVTAWVIAAMCFPRLSAATRADPHSFGIAHAQLGELAAQLDIPDNLTFEEASASPLPRCMSNPQAYADACRFRKTAWRELRQRGMQWVLADGYTNVWYWLHRAEEALILCAPRTEVIAQAITNEQRLEGSLIPTRDELLDQLRRAVVELDPRAAVYLHKQPPTQPSASSQLNTPGDEHDARRILYTVQRRLDEFLDERFEGIITARNRLAALSVVGGVFTYAVLCLAMLGRVTTASVIAVTAFYLTGSITGIFNWLAAVVTSDTAVPDYGLWRARLLATPTLSGLAAVGGIFILNVLSASIAGPPPPANTLEAIYVLTPHNLIIAAAFGLAPRLVISALQQQTDRYTSEIKSTLPTQQAKC